MPGRRLGVIDPHEVTSRESPRGHELTPVAQGGRRASAPTGLPRDDPQVPLGGTCNCVRAGPASGTLLCGTIGFVAALRKGRPRDHARGRRARRDRARVGAIGRCWQSPAGGTLVGVSPARRRSHRLRLISGSPTTRWSSRRSQHGAGGTRPSPPGAQPDPGAGNRYAECHPASRAPLHPSRRSQRTDPGCGRRTGAHTFAGTAKRYLQDGPVDAPYVGAGHYLGTVPTLCPSSWP